LKISSSFDDSKFAHAKAICNNREAVMKNKFDLEVQDGLLADRFHLSGLSIYVKSTPRALYNRSRHRPISLCSRWHVAVGFFITQSPLRGLVYNHSQRRIGYNNINKDFVGPV